MNKIMKDAIIFKTVPVVNAETGEFYGNSKVVPEELLIEYDIRHRKSSEAYKKKSEATDDVNYFGSLNGTKYTFSIERSVIELFNNDNFSDSEKVHIMYLGSFVNYEGYLMNKNKQPLKKSDVMKVVQIRNRARFYSFYNKLVESGFVKEKEVVDVTKECIKAVTRMYWNTELSFKGSPKDNSTSSNKVYRTYDDTIQRLYEENPAKSLAIIFRLLPYLNKFHNVLCKDTEATDYNDSQPLTVEEVGEAIGEADKKYLQRRLLKLRVGDEFIFSLRKTGTKVNVIMNPSLVWLSAYPPSNNLVGDFSLAKKQLLEDKNKKEKAIANLLKRRSCVN